MHLPKRVSATIDRDLLIPIFVIACITVGLILDSQSTPLEQLLLATIAWSILAVLWWGESQLVRMQVLVAVMFASIGEHFASGYLGGYIYRLENVPIYVFAGHGMVYLSALTIARNPAMLRARPWLTGVALVSGGLWSLWGVTLAPRPDAAGAVLFCVFTLFVFFGRSPMLYVAAFFITTYLELVGTWLGTWTWAMNDPVTGLSQANPPSGIAAWYCLVDAVALSGGVLLCRAVVSLQASLGKRREGRHAVDPGREIAEAEAD